MKYTTVGASVLLHHRHKLLFEVQKGHKWKMDANGRFLIGIGCIGGRIEPGESPLDALKRESVEELGATVRVLPHRNTFSLLSDGRLVDLGAADNPEGVFFYWHGDPKDYPGRRIAVFRGELEEEPLPLDLGGLMLGSLENVQRLLEYRIPAKDTRENGVTVLEHDRVPDDAVFFATGTLERLLLMERLYKIPGSFLFDRLLLDRRRESILINGSE